MKTHLRSALVLLAAGAALLGGKALLHERTRRMNQTTLNAPKLQPYAFGRFLVDLPTGIKVVSWTQEYKGAGPIKVNEDFTTPKFETLLRQRTEELRAKPHEKGGTLFEQEDALALPNCRQILYWDNDLLKQTLECDAYYLLQGRVYKINPSTNPDAKSKAEMKAANLDIFRSIRPRADEEVPTVPGFCFQGGIITEDISGMKRHTELLMVKIAWKQRPDVHFSFVAFGNGEMLDPPLLARMEKAGTASGEKVLRSTPRVVGPFQGEEYLSRLKEKNGTEGHLFIWESQGSSFNPNDPQLRLEMTTGDGPDGGVNASLSDKDALKLWDTIVASIRIRPTTPASPVTKP